MTIRKIPASRNPPASSRWHLGFSIKRGEFATPIIGYIRHLPVRLGSDGVAANCIHAQGDQMTNACTDVSREIIFFSSAPISSLQTVSSSGTIAPRGMAGMVRGAR
jgi:hypothetical protein